MFNHYQEPDFPCHTLCFFDCALSQGLREDFPIPRRCRSKPSLRSLQCSQTGSASQPPEALTRDWVVWVRLFGKNHDKVIKRYKERKVAKDSFGASSLQGFSRFSQFFSQLWLTSPAKSIQPMPSVIYHIRQEADLPQQGFELPTAYSLWDSWDA